MQNLPAEQRASVAATILHIQHVSIGVLTELVESAVTSGELSAHHAEQYYQELKSFARLAADHYAFALDQSDYAQWAGEVAK